MAAAKPNLRTVAPGEKPKAAKKQSVSEAAESGSHRALLVAMRERIAVTVSNPDCPPRDLAALTRRLQDIAKEIEVIDLRAKQEARESDDDSDGAQAEAWDEEAI